MSADDNKLLSLLAYQMCHKIDAESHLKGIQYPAFNKGLNTLYCVTGGVTYKVCMDNATGTYHVENLGEKSEASKIQFTNYKMHGDSLIKTGVKDLTKGTQIDKTAQFVEVKAGNKYEFYYRGSNVAVDVYDETQFALKKFMPTLKRVDTSKMVMSPMPGAVISVSIAAGQTVVDGQELLVIEAMKMQNIIRAEKEAKIKTVKVKKGQSVAVDEVLIEFE